MREIFFLLAPASLEENKHFFFKTNYFEKLEIQLQVEWRQVVLQYVWTTNPSADFVLHERENWELWRNVVFVLELYN